MADVKCANCGTTKGEHDVAGNCPTPAGAPANWARHVWTPMLLGYMRLSPDGRDLAICNRLDPYFPWRVTDGSQRSDRQVEDWTPVLSVLMALPGDTYVPPGVVAVPAPGVTVWNADEGGLFVRVNDVDAPPEPDEVWTEGFEAGVQHAVDSGRPGPNGPPDPPRNPYRED